MKRIYSLIFSCLAFIPAFAQLQPPSQVDTLVIERVSYKGEEVKPAYWPDTQIYRSADKIIVADQTYILKKLMHSYSQDFSDFDAVSLADEYKEYEATCNDKECRVVIVKRSQDKHRYTPEDRPAVIKYVIDGYSFFVHPIGQVQETVELIEETKNVSGSPTARVAGRITVGVPPRPSASRQKEGTVVVDVWVDQYGSVTRAVPGANGTTTTDKELWGVARDAALKAKFNRDMEAKQSQQGTITYVFKSVSSSASKEEVEIPFQLVEKQPSFKGGGPNEFTKWVNKQLVYPKECKDKGIQGRVTLQFTVTKEGDVTNVKVLRGVDPLLDAEAVRVVSSSPKWNPGTQRGRPVDVTYTYPLIFQDR